MEIEKFWMIKGSLGAPVVSYHDKQTAIERMKAIAIESGRVAFLLEAVMVASPLPRPLPEVIVEEL